MLENELNTKANKLAFDAELARFGPGQSTPTPLREARLYCSRWARMHYENFVVASLLLPRGLRQDFHNIYAYCRWADNLADEIPDPQSSLALLDWWERELVQCWRGSPRHPVMVALQQTIARHRLSPEPFHDLLSAFRQDQCVNRYADESQLLDYCSRSANPVGRILLQMAGAVTPENCQLSDQICTGLQLANFCQDLSRDAGQGRIFVPQQRWMRHGVDEAMFLERQVTDALRAMLAEWSAHARAYLIAGRPLTAKVPRWLRTDIQLFIGGGLAILDKIARQEYDVWSSRPRVAKWQQFRLLASSWLAKSGGNA